MMGAPLCGSRSSPGAVLLAAASALAWSRHAGNRQQRRQRRGLAVEDAGAGFGRAHVAGQGHRPVRGGGVAEGFAQLDRLLHQGDVGRVVAGRVARRGAVIDAVAGDQQADAVIVGGVDQVPQVQFTGRVRAAQLHPALRVGVVEQQLVLAGRAEFLAAHAPLGRAVAVAVAAARGAVPDRAIAGGQVALGRWRMTAVRATQPSSQVQGLPRVTH
jgi:hypothetical protein